MNKLQNIHEIEKEVPSTITYSNRHKRCRLKDGRKKIRARRKGRSRPWGKGANRGEDSRLVVEKT